MKNRFITTFKIGDSEFKIKKVSNSMQDKLDIWVGTRKSQLEKQGIMSLAAMKVHMVKGEGYLMPEDEKRIKKLTQERTPLQSRFLVLKQKGDLSKEEQEEFIKVSDELLTNIKAESEINERYNAEVFAYSSDMLVKKDVAYVLAALILVNADGTPVLEWGQDIRDRIFEFLDSDEETKIEAFNRGLFYANVLLQNPTADYDDPNVKEVLDNIFKGYVESGEEEEIIAQPEVGAVAH